MSVVTLFALKSHMILVRFPSAMFGTNLLSRTPESTYPAMKIREIID